MIKIISGKFRGRRLQDVPNLYVRPTQAVVRKSMMQILEPFDGAFVLDLYAGVGTLGLEALSRGASQLTSVESNGLVLETLRKNIELICKDEDIVIKAMDVNEFLKINSNKYDIIIADLPDAKKGFIGLWGELFLIVSSNNQVKVLEAWHNHAEDKYDFYDNNEALEVKCTTQGDRKHDFRHHQLVSKIEWSDYKDKRVLIKGCTSVPVPTWAYLIITAQLSQYAQHILYGEPCATVKIFTRD